MEISCANTNITKHDLRSLEVKKIGVYNGEDHEHRLSEYRQELHLKYKRLMAKYLN